MYKGKPQILCTMALWSYKDVDDSKIIGVDIKEVRWTGATVRIDLENEQRLYGVYAALPKVPKDVFEQIKDTVPNFVPADKLKSEVENYNLYNCAIRSSHIPQVYLLDFYYAISEDTMTDNNLKDLADSLTWTKDSCVSATYAINDMNKALRNTTATIDTWKDVIVDYNGYDNHSYDSCSISTNSSNDVHIHGNLYVDGEIKNTKRTEEERKDTSMSNIFGNIRTGEAGSKYAITYFGGIAFNGKTYHQGRIFEAQGMTFPFKMLYLIPSTSVAVNDIIEKEGVAYHVTAVESTGTITAVNLLTGKEENIVPGGPFGMTMYSKLFNPFGSMQGDNAFGNMMLMQAMSGGAGDAGNAMMMAMMMSQGGFKLPTFQMPVPTTEATPVDNK